MMRRKNSPGLGTGARDHITNINDKKYSKFQVFSLPDDGPGVYLGVINQTLRVVDVPSGDERRKNALQYLVDQHPARLLIMPDGEHKRSKATTLAKIAPDLIAVKRRQNIKNRLTKGKGRGSVFSKKRIHINNTLQTPEMPFLQNSRSCN